MRRAVVVLAGASLGAAVVFACGAPKLPAPPYTGHPTSALAEIPYPPPPARVETVPPRPHEAAVWIDGEWVWQTRRWAWKPGRWVKPPPPGARFAPWTAVRDRTGTLYIATGTWRDGSGAEIDEPEPYAIAGPAPAAIVTPEGEDVPTGPTVPLDAGTGLEVRDALDAAAEQALEDLDAARIEANRAAADAADDARTDDESEP